MTEYRSRRGRRGGPGRGRPRHHWSERSWFNPRRWLAGPLLAGTLGAMVTLTGTAGQALGGGFIPWGAAALGGLLLSVGAIAWAQSDLNYLRNRERK